MRMSAEIEHVVVLALENRSFDHVFGCLQQVYPALDGINPAGPMRSNSDQGTPYFQTPGAARFVCNDPHHEYKHVMTQLEKGNSGFVKDYAHEYPHSTAADRPE